MFRLSVCLCLVASALLAQSPGEKITVPIDDPGRPVRLRVSLMMGGVTVRGTDAKTVTVQALTGNSGENEHEREHARRGRRSDDKAEGMKRLDLPGNMGLDIVEQDNQVTVKSGPMGRPMNLLITVPRRSSLQLKCMNDGDIEVEGVEGEIETNNLNGGIKLKNVSGSVVAHSLNGEVSASLDRIDSGKPMSFSTMNGDIDVTLPQSLSANVLLKTDHGDIYSDFEVKLNSVAQRPLKSGRQSDGSYHLQFDHSMRGTINGGGAEFQFTSFNGEIYLRRRK